MYTSLPRQIAPDPTSHSGTYGHSFPAYQLNLSDDLTTVVDFETILSETVYPTEL